MEGLGATLKDPNNMACALRSGEPRYFVNLIAAGAVPADEACVNPYCVRKRVIALCVRDIDVLPWGQDENLIVEAVRVEQSLQFCVRQR